MRLANRRDSNQQQIMSALGKAGCTVADTSRVGNGYPDISVGRTYRAGGSHTYLLEIKSSRDATLTPDQLRFRSWWKGHYAVVWDVESALIAVGIIK